MSDVCDRADDECEHELAEALRIRKPPGPVATGICYYCLELIAPGLRWCEGTECEREWEHEWQRKQANGRVE